MADIGYRSRRAAVNININRIRILSSRRQEACG